MWIADFQGKTVLDLGADRGSTASYFLRNGAKFVVCVEGNPNRYRELQANMPLLVNAEPVFMQIQSSEDLATLLTYNAEIVKIDIEGDEQYLLQVPSWLIQQHGTYLVEIHTLVHVDITNILKFFQQLGFRAEYITKAYVS